MNKPCVVLVTGSGGDAQGWGNMKVTESVCEAVKANGFDCRIVLAENREELERGLKEGPCSIVWSCLYFFSTWEDIIGIPPDAVWVGDVLEELNIPYIGPSAQVMKTLLSKFETHRCLGANGVRIPQNRLCPPSNWSEINFFPAFVKPNGESRSVGINENSVAETPEALKKQIEFIQKELRQSALIEEYLPGKEYTVLVIGNGKKREILPGLVTVAKELYGKYPVLRSDLRGVGLTHISIPEDHQDEAIELANEACNALHCEDHVRIDMREGKDGKLRIMEVNGIPGLKPVKSWSPQIFALYHSGKDPYQALIGTIVSCSLQKISGHKS